MKNIDLYFLSLAALSLTVGVGLGISMAATHDHQLMPVHAHMNLVGWASLALFGLLYRVYPELAEGWLAKVHLASATSGAILLPIGIGLAVTRQIEGLAITASLLWFVGVLLLTAQVWRLFSLRK